MYGHCEICGEIYGMDSNMKEHPLCSHMPKKQKEFMEKKIPESTVYPGGKSSGSGRGRGSYNKAHLSLMRPLKRN